MKCFYATCGTIFKCNLNFEAASVSNGRLSIEFEEHSWEELTFPRFQFRRCSWLSRGEGCAAALRHFHLLSTKLGPET